MHGFILGTSEGKNQGDEVQWPLFNPFPLSKNIERLGRCTSTVVIRRDLMVIIYQQWNRLILSLQGGGVLVSASQVFNSCAAEVLESKFSPAVIHPFLAPFTGKYRPGGRKKYFQPQTTIKTGNIVIQCPFQQKSDTKYPAHYMKSHYQTFRTCFMVKSGSFSLALTEAGNIFYLQRRCKRTEWGFLLQRRLVFT